MRHSGFPLRGVHQPFHKTFDRIYGTTILPQVARPVTQNGGDVESDKLQKLRAKRDEANAKIRQELGRGRARKRRDDTRRKIIAGALVLVEQDPLIQQWLQRTLDKVLTRNDERSLFGLTLLPTEPAAPQQTARPNFGKLPTAPKTAQEGELA